MSARPTAKIYRGTPRNLRLLANAIKKGEVVGVPTETVYGLAGDALNVQAVKKIFRAKGRPSNDPLIVHLHSLAQLDALAETSPAVEKLARAFWPGPLTLVLPKKPAVPGLVTSGRPSVAVRIPRHPLFLALLRACARPLAAPSANPFGYISPTSAAHVRDGLGKKIRYILDGGTCDIGVESTILDLRDPRHPAILRPGAIARRAIERVLRMPVAAAHDEIVTSTQAAVAPGLLARHYSPRTPIELHEKLKPATTSSTREAFLFFQRPAKLPAGCTAINTFALTKNGALSNAAKTLFATLRKLDAGQWTKIHAERAPGDSALALAINDRLTRAAAKR